MLARTAERSAMARKTPTSFRLSAEAQRILEELEALHGTSKTAVLEQALRLLYRKETGRKNPPEKPGKPT